MKRSVTLCSITLALGAGCAGTMLVEEGAGTGGAGSGGAAGAPVDSAGGGVTGGTAGAPVDSAGGAVTGGAPPAAAGAGGTTPLPYPWEPTLPIDPSCTCATDAEICNAAAECVPRCDTEGRCALWLTEGAVQDLYLDGSVLYYLTAASQDPLGNPQPDGALWRVVTPDGAPEPVAGGLGSPHEIIGRVDGATYVAASDGVLEVSASGVGRTLGVGGEFACVLAAGALFCSSSTGMVRLALDPAATPELVLEVERGCFGLEADALVWCLNYGTSDPALYIVDPRDLSVSSVPLSTTAVVQWLVATTGSNLFAYLTPTSEIVSIDASGTQRLVMYRPPDDSALGDGRVFDGWLYAVEVTWIDSGSTTSLKRFPTSVGRLPQDVLPPELVTAASYCASSGGTCSTDRPMLFAVGEAGVFWAQRTLDFDGQGPNGPEYIFHGPLPPVPCDRELPCQRAGEVCGDAGLCEPGE